MLDAIKNITADHMFAFYAVSFFIMCFFYVVSKAEIEHNKLSNLFLSLADDKVKNKK